MIKYIVKSDGTKAVIKYFDPKFSDQNIEGYLKMENLGVGVKIEKVLDNGIIMEILEPLHKSIPTLNSK